MGLYWSIGNKAMFATILSDDTTLKNRDFRAETLIAVDTKDKTLTLPTPVKELVGYTLRVINTTTGGGAGTVTLSCTGKIFPAANTWTLATGGQCEVTCAQTAAGTYRWLVWDLTEDAHTHVKADVTDATATKAAGKIPIADGSGLLDTWITAQPVAAVFTPTLTWTTANPTISASVYRKLTYSGGVACVNMDITCSDGKGATALSVEFPTGLVPDDVDQLIIFHAQVSVNNGAYTNVVATLDAANNTAGSRVLNVTTGTLTNGQAARVLIKGGPYEV